MKRLLVLLLIMSSAPAMARDFQWNIAGFQYTDGEDYQLGRAIFRTEVGGQFTAGFRYSEAFGDGRAGSFTFGRYFNMTDKTAISLNGSAMRLSSDNNATWVYQPMIGIRTKIGDDFIGHIKVNYTWSDESATLSDDYFSYSLIGQMFPFEHDDFSVHTLISYSGYADEWRPGVGLSWHW